MSGRSRGLTYYYPTDSDNSKLNYVAPKIRVASSYGVCYPMDHEYAQKRCASYQEMSYPAGRWRMPTVGEIEYIIYLSNQGYIPLLFDRNTNYWSAQGIINTGNMTNGKLTPPTNLEGTSAVRCVYDEWYWGMTQYREQAPEPLIGKLIPSPGVIGRLISPRAIRVLQRPQWGRRTRQD